MADLNFQLLPWQQTVFSDQTRFKVVAAGRRCGKSRLAATTLLIEGLRCPPGSAVLYVAPTQGQARQIIWNVLLDLGKDIIANSHINNQDITLRQEGAWVVHRYAQGAQLVPRPVQVGADGHG